MAEAVKIAKEVALYIHLKGTNYKCKDCIFRKDHANRCAAYGSGISIKPWGGCGLFVFFKGTVDIPYLPAGMYTKENTGYVENQPGFTCGRCDEFLPEDQDCKKIDKDSAGDDPGKITSGGCCNRWAKMQANG